MNIPKYVEEAIFKSAKYHEKARVKQNVFEDWISREFGEDVINNDGVRDTIIDLVEQSNRPDDAIDYLKTHLEELALSKE